MQDYSSTTSTVPTDRSVTCAICGALADERETVSLWADDHDPTPPSNRQTIAMLPDGEAHTECFQRVADDPVLVPEDALDIIMAFLRRDEHLRSHADEDDPDCYAHASEEAIKREIELFSEGQHDTVTLTTPLPDDL
jgi:hypothetical protein